MDRTRRALRAFRRLFAFELRRFATPFRIMLGAASLISMVVLAKDNLFRQIAITSSQLTTGGDVPFLSPTAFDMAYLAFNDKLITGLLLPIVCGALTADCMVRDRGGMRTTIVCEIRSSCVYVAAKLATVAVVCHVFVLLFVMACTIVSFAFLGLPISTEPSAWLSSAGPQDSVWGPYGPIPGAWNYIVLIVALGVGFGILETVLSWTAMSLCSFLESPSAASLVVASVYVVIAQVESLITSFGLILGIESMTTTTGWIVDRLCLANYRLGTSLFQKVAGGAYRGFIPVPADVAANTYPINSWMSLLSILLVLAISSTAWLLVREARCRAQL